VSAAEKTASGELKCALRAEGLNGRCRRELRTALRELGERLDRVAPFLSGDAALHVTVAIGHLRSGR
jgi:hypothetical protein